MDVLYELGIYRQDIRDSGKRVSTYEIGTEVPSPDYAADEEGQDENDTIYKLKPRSCQIDFVLR